MTSVPPFKCRLGVIGAPPTWQDGRQGLIVYEPYVREMRVWADLFKSVVVLGPRGEGPPRGNLAPYERPNIRWIPSEYTFRISPGAAVRRLTQLPGMVRQVFNIIQSSDFILLRSPSHFGLVGGIMVRLLRRQSITKWAGENGAYRGERLPSRMNRWVERILPDGHLVLVYGPPRGPNQISFIPALMLEQELQTAKALSGDRRWSEPWNILSVGRMEQVKGLDLALRGLARFRADHPNVQWNYTLIGEGPIRAELQSLAQSLGIGDRVEFLGAKPFEEAQRHYGRSHVVIMPGTKEGWPKVVAEAWAHGAIPFAAARGLIPSILSESASGVMFEPEPESFSSRLAGLLASPERMRVMSEGLYARAYDVSLDQFKRRLHAILVQQFALSSQPEKA